MSSEGWNVECSEFMNSASRRSNGQTTEVEVDPDGITVEAEVGSGYMRESTRSFVPMEVLVRMLEHAGFSVSRR